MLHLSSPSRVMDEGVPVLGCIHQIGPHEVDRETFERTPKPSAGVYADPVKQVRA